jgi:hypothetical protein
MFGAASGQEAVDDAFDILTQGLAACSFAPGGVDFVGLHFESDQRWLRDNKRIEVLEEFAAASRLRGDRSLSGELLGFFDERAATATAHVIHRDLPAEGRREAAVRASNWYYDHRQQLIDRRKASRDRLATAAPQGPCAHCGAPIAERPKRGPLVKKWCSKRCNYRAWVLRKRASVQSAAVGA